METFSSGLLVKIAGFTITAKVRVENNPIILVRDFTVVIFMSCTTQHPSSSSELEDLQQ